MSESKEELNAASDAIYAKLRVIEDKEWVALNKSLVGKCFKYHNSYGGDRPRWWLYAKVLSAKSKWDCRCFEFATDCDGKHFIEPTERVSPNFIGGDGSSWKPITAAEFNREFAKLRRKIAGYKP